MTSILWAVLFWKVEVQLIIVSVLIEYPPSQHIMLMSLAVPTPQAVKYGSSRPHTGSSGAHGPSMPAARMKSMTCRPQPRVHIVTRAESGPQDPQGPGKKKFLTREEEPEEYWTSKAERDGESPMKDPMAWIGIGGILLPFVILGVAVAVGYVDLSP